MAISEEEINAKMTAAGGFTKAQLAEWGVPWPPPKGWKKRLIEGVGKEHERYMTSHQKHRIHETKDIFDSDCYLCQKAADKKQRSFWSDGV